jgi:multidrug resistance efflux pump
MSTIILDTLEFASKLKAGGFTEQQAETQARAIAELVEKQLVDKRAMEESRESLQRDIRDSENRLEIRMKELEARMKELETNLRKDIELLRSETKKDIAEIRKKIAETKAELIRWVVGVGVLQFALIAGLLVKLVDRV